MKRKEQNTSLKKLIKKKKISYKQNIIQRAYTEQDLNADPAWLVEDVMGEIRDQLENALKLFTGRQDVSLPRIINCSRRYFVEKLNALVAKGHKLPQNEEELGALPQAFTEKNFGTIYFNNWHPIFTSDYVKKSTVIHETMHSLSSGHMGFQPRPSWDQPIPEILPQGPSVDPASQWDEAVTDFFAKRIFISICGPDNPFHTQYKVAYPNPEGAETEALEAVEALKSVHSITEEELRDMYLRSPDRFHALMTNATPEQKTNLRTFWMNRLKLSQGSA